MGARQSRRGEITMPNVALVVLDTLRKDTFDEFFDWYRGLHFENAYSTGAWTVPAHGSLFTGKYPSENGVHAENERLTCEDPVLAEVLSENGYTTRAWSANAYVSPAFGYDRGFDEWNTNWFGRMRDPDVFDWNSFISETQGDGPSRFARGLYECLSSGTNTVESLKRGVQLKARDLGIDSIAGRDDGAWEALEWVQDTEFGDNEFLFMNLMEAHLPYNPPNDWQTTSLDRSPTFHDTVTGGSDLDGDAIRQAYDDAARYLSTVYQHIFNLLKSDFDYIVTVGDHGEMFGERGVWLHSHGIYPQLTHVPLAIYDGRKGQESTDVTVGLRDVHRTILDVAGVEDAASGGQNLLADPESRPQLTERHGLREAEHETLRKHDVDAATINRHNQALFGVVDEDGRYGYETLDGFETNAAARADEVEALLADLRSGLDEVHVDSDTGDVPVSVKSQLKDLGYA